MAGRRALLVALAGLAALPSGAQGVEGLRIAPARVDAEVRRGDRLPAVRVTNGSPVKVRLRAEARLAGQDLDGLPAIDDRPGARARGRGFLAVSPARFTLKPGESREVTGRVTGGPRRGRGAYGVVLVTGRPARGSERAGAAVAPVLRLAGNVLLTYRGAARSRITADHLRVVPGGQGVLRFLTRATNRGRIHDISSTELRVRDARGRLRVRARTAKAGAVLPGAKRDLLTDVTRRLPAGAYTAVSVVRDGARVTRAKLRFRLSGPNELPAADLRLAGLSAPRPPAGEAFTTPVRVRNAGSAAGAPVLEAVLSTARGEELARRRVRGARLAAGEQRAVDVRWPAVEAGAYQLEVSLADGGERTVVFETGARTPALTRALDWLAAHLPLLLGGLALIALLVGAGVFAHVRGLQRRLRELERAV
jgi:hypothetical protein